MPYVAPYIDASGLHLPTYNDILMDMISKVLAIYPDSYLLNSDGSINNDAADVQHLSIIALKTYDAMLAGQLAYNNRSPISAIGSGLDSIFKLNGGKRKTPSYSTCAVTLTGTPGAVITNGAVTDTSGNAWSLPASVTIGGGGTVTVTATCQVLGAITALNGTLTSIATPTLGWLSVTNSSPATSGTALELDSQVRSRQAVSVAGPSSTRLQSTEAAIAALAGVTRYQLFENPTGSSGTDPNGLGLPAHSLTCVVEGDTDENVAQAIYKNRGIGCLLNGTTEITVVDPTYHAQTFIKFYRPTYVPIWVTATVKAGYGFTSATLDQIKQAITNYLNALWFYQDVTISGLEGAALSILPNLARPSFAVESLIAGISSGAQAATDIPIAYNAVSQGALANVSVTTV